MAHRAHDGGLSLINLNSLLDFNLLFAGSDAIRFLEYGIALVLLVVDTVRLQYALGNRINLFL